MKLYSLFYLIAGMLAALVVAVLVVSNGVDLPPEDLRQLVTFMLVTGFGTTLVGYSLYRWVLTRRSRGLRWSLLVLVGFTIFLIYVNVWATARLMFINQRDLVLTGGLLIFAGLTALAFGLYVAGNIVQRVRVISRAVDQVAQGDLETRLTVEGGDEVSRLAAQVNWMAENLQEIDRQKQLIDQTRRDLIAWISHDLRTPLTAIRALLEAINDGIVTEPEDINTYVQNALSEVDSMKGLINDLFDLAQLDAGHTSIDITEASLRDLISDIVSGMMAKAQRRHVSINGQIAPTIDPVCMAPDKIQRVLYNLIDNAIRYTPPEGVITIRARHETGTVRVDVHNTGSSIAPEQVPHVFNKFYRGESARESAEDGQRSAGLGLAIAKGFIEAHQGRIWVESTPETGTQFSFAIPNGRDAYAVDGVAAAGET